MAAEPSGPCVILARHDDGAERMIKFIGRQASARSEQAYWLAHCHGFAVERGGRRLGVVTDVRFRTRVDRPDEIVVRRGVLRRGSVTLPVGEVAAILPRRRTVELVPRPRPRLGRRSSAETGVLVREALAETPT
jgi:hypothetical protein